MENIVVLFNDRIREARLLIAKEEYKEAYELLTNLDEEIMSKKSTVKKMLKYTKKFVKSAPDSIETKYKPIQAFFRCLIDAFKWFGDWARQSANPTENQEEGVENDG